MNATIRGLKGLLALSALAGLGLLLRWVTTDSIEAATVQDLTSMASLAIGAVAWVAYCWLVVAILATVLEQAPGAIGRGASAVATRITSQGSRTLLRSALGVAAVTPLTIGVAHATPGDGSHRITESRPWTSVEPHSKLTLTSEPRPGSRPWSSVEPRSTVEVGGDSPADWRAVEEPSSIQVTGEGTSKPPANSARTGREQPAKPEYGKQTPTARTAVPGKQVPAGPTARPEKQTPSGRTAVPAKQTPVGRTAVPEKRMPAGRTAVPAKSPVGQVAVPDRPTTGAPTRYTNLQSGQLTRAAPHVVKPGDSLWSIAAAELGPHATDETIAARWPQWYATNRQLIGPDPDLIQPGQVLTAPAPVHPVPPTHQEK